MAITLQRRIWPVCPKFPGPTARQLRLQALSPAVVAVRHTDQLWKVPLPLAMAAHAHLTLSVRAAAQCFSEADCGQGAKSSCVSRRCESPPGACRRTSAASSCTKGAKCCAGHLHYFKAVCQVSSTARPREPPSCSEAQTCGPRVPSQMGHSPIDQECGQCLVEHGSNRYLRWLSLGMQGLMRRRAWQSLHKGHVCSGYTHGS